MSLNPAAAKSRLGDRGVVMVAYALLVAPAGAILTASVLPIPGAGR